MSTLVKLGKEQRLAGPNGNYGPGDEVIIDDALAKAMARSGATIIRKVKEKNTESKEEKKEIKEPETAMVEPAEKAVMPRPRKIKAGSKPNKPRTVKK